MKRSVTKQLRNRGEFELKNEKCKVEFLERLDVVETMNHGIFYAKGFKLYYLIKYLSTHSYINNQRKKCLPI